MKILIIILCALPLGCATDTPDAAANRRGRVTNAVAGEVFNAVLNFGLSEGRQYLTGQNGQDAAAGAFDAAAGLISSESIGRIVAAYAGPEVATIAQTQFDAADPKTPGDKVLIANTIGAALQLAANQLTK